MSLFVNFPKINFKVDDYNSIRAVDITTSIRIKKFLKEYRGIRYNPYIIRDGERPDTVSFKIYQNPNYDWLVMLVNDIYSVYDDWPKDQETFKKYIIEKYGSITAASSEIKYYYDAQKTIIDFETYHTLPSTQRSSESCLQYEQRLNDNKSRIRVIQPGLIGTIQTQLNSELISPIR